MVVEGAGASNNGGVGVKNTPLRKEGWWWGWKTPTLCFNVKEVGKIENSHMVDPVW